MSQLLILAATIRVAIPAVPVDHAQGPLSGRISQFFGAAIEHCSSPLPASKLDADAVNSLEKCKEDPGCVAKVGHSIGVDVVLTGSAEVKGDTYALKFAAIDVRDAKVRGHSEIRYEGKVEGLEAKIKESSGELCKLVSPEGAVAASTLGGDLDFALPEEMPAPVPAPAVVETPKKEVAKTETPVAPEPKKEVAKTETPVAPVVADPPKKEVAKTETPVVPEPKKEVAKVETPVAPVVPEPKKEVAKTETPVAPILAEPKKEVAKAETPIAPVVPEPKKEVAKAETPIAPVVAPPVAAEAKKEVTNEVPPVAAVLPPAAEAAKPPADVLDVPILAVELPKTDAAKVEAVKPEPTTVEPPKTDAVADAAKTEPVPSYLRNAIRADQEEKAKTPADAASPAISTDLPKTTQPKPSAPFLKNVKWEWVGAGATGVLAIVAIAVGAKANSLWSSDQTVSQQGITRHTITYTQAHQANSMAASADVLFAAAAAAAIGTGVFVYVHGGFGFSGHF